MVLPGFGLNVLRLLYGAGKRKDYRYKYSDAETAFKLVFFGVVAILMFWYTNKLNCWLLFWLVFVLIAVVGILIILWDEYKIKKRKDLVEACEKAGGEDKLTNFIDSFGLQKKAGDKVWKHGEYSFTYEEVDRFVKILKENGISVKNKNDIYFLLYYYIEKKQDRYMRETVARTHNTFSNLSGTDFEALLYRLYTAMGYSVMKTGKTGDQGCDLVVNMGDQRAVVQAKCYDGSVGNAAVQQAIGALKLYNCTKGIVVTNSYFTPEAIQLAKADNVDLISGVKLREMLLQYLKENWG